MVKLHIVKDVNYEEALNQANKVFENPRKNKSESIDYYINVYLFLIFLTLMIIFIFYAYLK